MNDVFLVILAGGQGTRLWPLSTPDKPKQFLQLTSDGLTLLEQTIRRAERLVPRTRILIVSPEEQVGFVTEQAQGCSIVQEPVGRNTAAAIALAASWVEMRHPGGIVVVLSSDHVIRNEHIWESAMRAGVSHASEEDRLVTFGIPVSEPDPRYGYILLDKILDQQEDHAIYAVDRFREKPPVEEIQDLLATGNCRRNTGMFVWRTSVFLEALKQHLPAIAQVVQTMSPGGQLVNAEAYSMLPSVSVDHGILQQSAKVSVVDTHIDRVDLGNLISLRELWSCDGEENAGNSRFTAVQSRGNTVYSSAGHVALVGVDDLVIAVTDKAVLVCGADHIQDIGDLAKRLEKDESGTTIEDDRETK